MLWWCDNKSDLIWFWFDLMVRSDLCVEHCAPECTDSLCKLKSHWITTINGKIYVWKCKLIFPTDTVQQKIQITDFKPFLACENTSVLNFGHHCTFKLCFVLWWESWILIIDFFYCRYYYIIDIHTKNSNILKYYCNLKPVFYFNILKCNLFLWRRSWIFRSHYSIL